MESTKLVISVAKVAFQILLLPIYWLIAIWSAIFDGEGKKLDGKIVMVTGAGNGLGKEITLQLARQGALVLGIDLRIEDLEDTVRSAEEITKAKGKVHPYVCDISDRTAVTKLRDSVLKDHGHLDILINNAAIVYSGHFEKGEDAELERVVNVNILGNMWMCRAFLPSMKKRKEGHIAFISSMGGLLPHKDLCLYSATKSALTALGQCLRQSLESQPGLEKIKVTIVHPGVISTSALIKKVFKSALPPMPCKFAAASIIKAIRNDYTDITLPGGAIGYSLIQLLKSLPMKLRNMPVQECRFAQVKGAGNIATNNISYREMLSQKEFSSPTISFEESC